MKELTLEQLKQKAKAYDEALERAKISNSKDMKQGVKDIVTYIFPELKESTDERIRKALIDFFCKSAENGAQTNGVYDKDILAWLEKQGEQKTADKVEPNFHVGDWVVGGNAVYQIIALNNELQCYIAVSINNETVKIPYYFDCGQNHMCSYHLWTIDDANPGDILFHSDSASNGIFIFKEILQCGTLQKVMCYCDYDSEDGFCLGENHTCCWTNNKILHPANKEQREILLKAMDDAGYTFDFEKKDVKKIEQKPVNKMIEPKFHVGDWCIDDEDGIIFQIVKVLDHTYIYRTNEGKEDSCPHYLLEKYCHLWTIVDAKNGDVLAASDNSIFIFKDVWGTSCKHYIALASDNEIRVNTKLDKFWETTRGVKPATKEQRDTLIKAMTNNRYTFDFEKKELNKIVSCPKNP